MSASEIIEKVLAEASNSEQVAHLGVEQRKELAAAIVKALRKEYLIVPYGGQVTFE